MPDQGNLAVMILDKAKESSEGKEEGEGYSKMAKKEAGDAFIRAIRDGNGEMVAQALQDLYDVSMN
jgi:hypothetical protein|tara:strand:- start:1061 stop:1258 length:198 start_codon:yes stop_codon:yes gene_type:complete